MAGIDFGSLAAATPAGAAASIGVAAVSTPTSSTSGDIKSGFKNFGNTIGGISSGLQIPPWVWLAVAVGVGLYLWKKR